MGSYARKAKRNKEKLTAEKPPRHCGVHAKMSKIGLWYCPKCGKYILAKNQTVDSTGDIVEIPSAPITISDNSNNVIDTNYEVIEDTPEVETIEV